MNASFKTLLVLATICLLSFNSFGQTLEGYVFDAYTDEPLINVEVELYIDNELVGTELTDATGLFLFHTKRVDWYKLTISKKGYRTLKRNYTWISGQKDEFYMWEKKVLAGSDMYSDSIHLKGRDNYYDVDRLGNGLMTFDDPMRTLALAPGAVLMDDASNAISFQGIPATFNSFYMDGFEVGNMNHFRQLGSYNDLVSSGGGMTNPVGNISSISINAPGSNRYRQGNIGAGFNFEFDNEENYISFGTSSMEVGYNIGRISAGLKMGYPNSFSNLGTSFDWGNSAYGALQLRYVNKTVQKEDIINLYYGGSYFTSLSDIEGVTDQSISSSRFRSKKLIISRSYRYKKHKFDYMWSPSGEDYEERLSFFIGMPIERRLRNNKIDSRWHYGYTYLYDENISWGISRQRLSEGIGAFENDFLDRFYNRNMSIFRFIYNQKIELSSLDMYLSLKPGYIRDVNREIIFYPDFSIEFNFKNNNQVLVSYTSQFTEQGIADINIPQLIHLQGSFILDEKKKNKVSLIPFFNYFLRRKSIIKFLDFNYTPSRALEFVGLNSGLGLASSFGVSVNIDAKVDNNVSYTSNYTALRSMFNFRDEWLFSDLSHTISSNQSLVYHYRIKKNRSLNVMANAAIVLGRRSYDREQIDLVPNGGLNEAVGPRFNTFRLDVGLSYDTNFGQLKLSVHNVGNLQNKSHLYYSIIDDEYNWARQAGMIPFLTYKISL